VRSQRSADLATQALLEDCRFIFGDWNRAGCSASVVARVEEADEGTYLVHISPPNGWGCALFVW